MRRSVELAQLQDHHDVAGFFIGVLGVIYAVLLAFVVIVVWEEFSDASSGVNAEASQVLDVYWLAEGFQPADRDRIQAATRAYAETVISEEWDELADGEHSPAADRALNDLRLIFAGMNPAGGREQALYDESIDRLSSVSDRRAARIHDAGEGLPWAMWVVLAVGAVVTIAFTYFFGVRSLRSQAMMTSGLTIMIVLALILIYGINHPFRGDLKIEPGAFEQAIEEMSADQGGQSLMPTLRFI
jgi:hypothetical protein